MVASNWIESRLIDKQERNLIDSRGEIKKEK